MKRLDLIINALEYAADKIYCQNNDDIIAQALSAARNLRALKPVARFNWNEAKFEWLTKYDYHKHHMTPLYDLGGDNEQAS